MVDVSNGADNRHLGRTFTRCREVSMIEQCVAVERVPTQGVLNGRKEEIYFLPTTALVVACPDSDQGGHGLYPEIRRFLFENFNLQEGNIFPVLRDGGGLALVHSRHLAVDCESLKASIRRIAALKKLITDVFYFFHSPCGYCNLEIRGKVPEMEKEDTMVEVYSAKKMKDVAPSILPGKKDHVFHIASKGKSFAFKEIS